MADFQRAIPDFDERGAQVIAASTDNADDARSLVSEAGLTFPIGYGLDAEEISSKLGSYYHRKRGFLHATSFLLHPDGTVAVACYSSGAMGRLTPGECLWLIDYYTKPSS